MQLLKICVCFRAVGVFGLLIVVAMLNMNRLTMPVSEVVKGRPLSLSVSRRESLRYA